MCWKVLASLVGTYLLIAKMHGGRSSAGVLRADQAYLLGQCNVEFLFCLPLEQYKKECSVLR